MRGGEVITESWEIDGPFDLRLSLRFSLPSSIYDGSGGAASYGLRYPSGPASVSLSVDGDTLAASVHGEGAEEAIAAVPRTLGLDDDPDSFTAPEGPLRDLHRRYRGLRLGSTGRVFDTILPTVIGQRVTTGEAKRSYRRIVRALGEEAPGDVGLRLLPTPAAVAALSFDDLHHFGIEKARAKVVLEVAQRANRLEEITTMGRKDALNRLLAISGVGPWTAGHVMGAAWGDRDAVPIGDYHLPNTVAWLLAGEPRADDNRMLELLESSRPNRRRAMVLAKLSGVHAPRYGPRSSRSVISEQRG